ncbi:MAG: type II CAAX endopeptidase family protein [Acidobacteriota bacterium]
MSRWVAVTLAVASMLPLGLASEGGDWISRLRHAQTAYLSLAVSEDRVAIGGPGGIVLLETATGRVGMRWPEAVDRVWIDEAGALWALPSETEGQALFLLKWNRDATAPEDFPIDDARGAGVTRWHSELPIPKTTGEPAELLDSLGPARDAQGGLWRVTAEAGSIWKSGPGAWRKIGSVPSRIGSPLELQGDPHDDSLWLLGTTGVARVAGDGSTRVLFSETVRDLLPTWLLAILAVAPAIAIAVPIGGALAFGSWWRGVRAWSLLDGALALGLFLGGQLCVAAALWAFGLEMFGTGMIVGSFSGGSVASLLFLAWRLRVQGLSWSQLGLTRTPWMNELLWGLGTAGAAWVVLPLLDWICRSLSVPTFLYEQSLGQSLDPHGALETIALTIAIAVMAPLTEEILFRGYALRALSLRCGRWPALLITTVLFGAAHGEGALMTGTLGLIFAWVAIRRESIWPTIVAHALINGVSLTLVLSGLAK